MIIYNIQDHSKTAGVQRLYHFLHFPDTDFSMPGVCSIGTFRDIIVYRIIPPVKLSSIS